MGISRELWRSRRVRGGSHRHRQRRHVVIETLGDGVDFFEAVARFRGCPGNLAKGNAAHEATPVFGGRIGAWGNVFVCEKALVSDAFLVSHFHRHGSAQHVAGMVEDHEEDACLALRQA